jgi:hypothetical protein
MDDWMDGDEAPHVPVHPDDRLWRHPSELRAVGAPAAASAMPDVPVGAAHRPLGGRLLLGAVVVMAVVAAWWATQSLEVDMAPPTSKASAATSPIATETIAAAGASGSTSLVATTTSMAGLAGRSATVGLLITWVDPSNVLAQAGVRAGDHLLAVNGIDITSMGDLVAVLQLVAHKDTVPLYVARGSRNLVLTADLPG